MKLPKLYTIDSNLKEIPVNVTKWLVIFLLILLAVVFCSAAIFKKEKEKIYVEAEKEIILKNNNEFSKEKFIQEIKKYNFKYESVVIAQAILESGNFKSTVFKHNHNAFGMREPRSRISSSQGTRFNYSYYPSYVYSIADRALYEARYLSGLSKEEYYRVLDEVYSEGGGYSEKLKQIIKTHKL